MSSLDIYDDTENLISSDDYSDEDDDELMNAAVSTHHNKKPENSERYYHRPTVHNKTEQTKEHPRPPFRKILCSKYKSRSLKWLNGRAKREKSKQYLLCLKRKETSRLEAKKREKDIVLADDWKEDKNSIDLSEPIELEESDIEYSSPIKSNEKTRKDSQEDAKEIIKDQKIERAKREVIEKSNELVIEKQKELHAKQKELVEKQRELYEKQKDLVEREKRLVDDQAEFAYKQKETLEKQKEIAVEPEKLNEKQDAVEKPAEVEKQLDEETHKKSQKRPRSISPITEKEEVENKNKKQQPERPNSTQLYREINEMFPKYDEVVSNHVKHNSTTIEQVDENMKRLMQDIQTLNDIIQAKETEWNRLLNLKRVKEEILERLARKKHILNSQDSKFEDKKYNLQTLKELELYLSESQPPSTSAKIGLSTTHQIIESRASMKTEELEKERGNTTRLQNILISSNILQRAEACNNEFNPAKNNEPNDDHNAELQKYQYLEQRVKSKSGRQGPLVDVKSIVADFRQQNPIVFPRVGKRIKTNDVNYNMRAMSTSPNGVDVNNVFMETYNGNGSNYSPTLEKLLSTSSRNNSITHAKHHGAPTTQGFKFNTESQKSYYRLQSDDGCNEISITPVNCINRYPQRMQNSKTGLLRTALDVQSQNNDYYDMPEYGKSTHKVMRGGMRNNDSQSCQECKMNEARFVCAGCGNQWYCSRECQVNAWDKHSEICSE